MVQGVVETAKGETVSTVTIVVPAPGPAHLGDDLARGRPDHLGRHGGRDVPFHRRQLDRGLRLMVPSLTGAPTPIPSRSSVHETRRLERPGGTFQNQR
jgi:hypothetical protein